MGQITVLSLQDTATGVYFAIPVTNFPIIPIGSLVTLKLGPYTFEDLAVKYYSASNYLGNSVDVEFNTEQLNPGEPTLEQLSSLMKVDEEQTFGCRSLYPETINFG